MQSDVRKGEYSVHCSWCGQCRELCTASNHVIGVNRPPPQAIQSGTDTFEWVESSESYISRGLAPLTQCCLCVEVYVQQLVVHLHSADCDFITEQF